MVCILYREKQVVLEVYNDWIAAADEESSEEDISNQDNSNSGSRIKTEDKFGITPKYTCVYWVNYDHTKGVLKCTCCHQERLSMPCEHTGVVIQQNKDFNMIHNLGFPIEAMSCFWCTNFYLYGIDLCH